MKKTIIMTICLLMIGVLFAQGSPGLTYTSINNNTAYEVSRGTATATHIVIPATYNSRPVTRIASSGFSGHTTMTDITLPPSITELGYRAFFDCTNLASIDIPAGVTIIGESAFERCTYLASHITIPAGVTRIESRTFMNCRYLTSVILPDGITFIGNQAFAYCERLVSINMPNSVTSIEREAFISTKLNIPIVIPASCTSIGTYAFRGITPLPSIVIPASVTRIGQGAFMACHSLTIYAEATSQPTGWSTDWNSTSCPVVWGFTLTPPIPPTDLRIAEITEQHIRLEWDFSSTRNTNVHAGFRVYRRISSAETEELVATITNPTRTYFEDTTITPWSAEFVYRVTTLYTAPSMESEPSNIAVATRLSFIRTQEDTYGVSGGTGPYIATHYEIPATYNGLPVVRIRNNAFTDFTNMTSINLPDTITDIGSGAFTRTSISSINLPDGLTNFGNAAFMGCSNLSSIVIPNSVETIGARVFLDCTGLTSISIGSGVTSIGQNAFDGITGITSFFVDSNVAVNLFNGSTTLTTLVIGDNVTAEVGNSMFLDSTSLTSVTIGNGVRRIGSDAFRGCTNLESVIIGNSVNVIAGNAFHSCTKLSSVVFTNEDGAAGIVLGISVFRNCTSLKAIDLSRIVSMGSGVFYGCTNLEDVKLGNDIISIDSNAFNGCSSLIDIFIPISVTTMGANVFANCTSLTIYAEADSQPAGWSTSWNSGRPVVWGSLATPTRGLAYSLINSGTEYQVSIGTATDTFIIIPAIHEGLPVTTIPLSGFRNQTNIISVTLPNSITDIGTSAFRECTSLTSINIPNSVTSIIDHAFNGCTSLTSINIPNSVTSIGISAFEDCTSLTSINIPDSVTSIERFAFRRCTSLTSMIIPASVTSIGNAVFSQCTNLTYTVIPASVTSIGNTAFYGCTNLTIYAEAESRPAGWNTSWNIDSRPVIWDYTNKALPATALSAVYKSETINLSWTAPETVEHWTLSHYLVYRDDVLIEEEITEPYFADTEIEADMEYTYHITAVYSVPPIESTPSNPVTIDLSNILPVTLSVFGATSIESGLKIYWTAELETNMLGYRVWRAETSDLAAGAIISTLIPAQNNPTTEYYHHIDKEVINGKEYFYWLEVIELDSSIEMFGPVSIVYTPEDEQPITMTTMSSAYPNPMSLGTIANFDISVKANETAELRIYNIRGQMVRSYENIPAGHQRVIWDGRDFNGREVSSGVYYYRLTSPTSYSVKRMVVVK